MLSEIQKESGHLKPVEIEMHIGNEILNAYFENETFSISAVKNKELEEDITNKLKAEFKKKYPSMCREFIPRIYTE